MNHDSVSSKQITKQQGTSLSMTTLGAQIQLFRPKMTRNIRFLLITSKYKAVNDTKQPHYDIYNNVLHYFFYFFKYLSLAIGNNTKQYHPRGSNTPIWTRNDTKYRCFVNNSSIQSFWLDNKSHKNPFEINHDIVFSK